MLATVHRTLVTKTSNLGWRTLAARTPYLGTVSFHDRTITNSQTPGSFNLVRPISMSSGLSRTQKPKSGNPLPSSTETSTSVKPYKEIPGPWKIPLLQITPELLRSDPFKSIQLMSELQKKYGSFFKARFSPTVPEFVMAFDPKDAAKVFRNDGKYPKRFSVDVWIETRKALGVPVGLFLSDGENWHEQRRPISKFMMMPRKVAEYHEPFNDVTFDLLKKIRKSRDESGNLFDASSYFYKWSFESVSLFVLGKRLGCLDDQTPPDCQEFIDATHTFLEVTHKLFFSLPLHMLYPTKNWKDLMKAFQRVFEISMKHIKEKLEEIKEEDTRALENDEDQQAPVGVDFLTYMSHAGKMPLEKITSNAIDLMSAGIDTTSLTLLWTLYSLATNPEVQIKLRDEIQQAVGSDNIVTPSHIHQMPYLRDCIREAQRLYAIAPNNSRILEEDIVLSGYRVPAGTCIIMPIVGAGGIEENFPEPKRYFPDRWSRDSKDPPNVFASLPFGFGTRMCVGRRVAELELHIALAQLIKNFRVEYRGEKPMDYIQTLFLVPDGRLDLAFVDL